MNAMFNKNTVAAQRAASIVAIVGLMVTSFPAGFTGWDTAEAAVVSATNTGNSFSSVSFTANDFSWSHPDRAETSNDSYATSDLDDSSHPSEYLKVKDFGFNIPVGATINGIEVNVERHQVCNTQNCSTSQVTDNIVRLINGSGTIVGDNKADLVTAWGTTDATVAYGSSGDLWNASLARTDVNDADFGVVFSAQRNTGGKRTALVDQITITVYYTEAPTTGDLTITKTTVGGDGTFDFVLSGTTTVAHITTSGGTGSVTVNGLAPTTYTITETVPAGWDKGADTCITGVAVSAGSTAGCGVTNTKRGSITIHKDVVAPDGATDVSDSHPFNVTLDGVDQKTIAEGSTAKYDNLAPGPYTIAEITGDPDFDLLRISGDNDDDASNGAVVNVIAGTNLDVTIINRQHQGTLHVTKRVDNSHALGTSVAADFSVSVNNGPAHPFVSDGDDSIGAVDVLVDPGNYHALETDSHGYAPDYSSGCNGSMTSGGEAACDIINYDLTPGKGAITVIKNVVKDNNGNAEAGDFSLQITEGDVNTPAISGRAYQLLPSTYTVSEVALTGELAEEYQYVSTACTDNGSPMNGNVINLEAGHVYVCTITNDDQPGQLTIVKNSGDYDGTFTFSVTGQDNFPLTTEEGTGSETLTLDRGDYDVVEDVPAGWTLSNVSCLYGDQEAGSEIDNGEHITVANGGHVTCTFTNERQTGTLIVEKNVDNGDEEGTATAGDFSFRVAQGDTTNDPVAFDQDGENPLHGENTLTLPTGTYSVSEVPVDGYLTTYEGCDEIVVNTEEPAMCSITNTAHPGDTTEPVSTFTDGDQQSNTIMSHVTIDTEIVALNLSGQSTDNESGVASAEMKIWKIADETVVRAPGFNVQSDDLSCSNIPVENVPIEIVALSLTGSNPATWSHSWTPPAPGVYCVKVSATDAAGITEHTAIAGPFAIIPPVAPTPAPISAPPSGGGGGNGPISGSFGLVNNPVTGVAGQVLGASTQDFGAQCERYLTKFIKQGNANDPEQVTRLQTVLKNFEGAGIGISGIYDNATLAAVHAFQMKYATDILRPWGASKSTGFVYLTTRKKVNEVYCRNTNSFPLTSEEQSIIERYKSGRVESGATVGTPAVQPSPESATAPVTNGPAGGGTPGATGAEESQVGAAAAAEQPARGLWSRVKGLLGF